MGRLQAQSFKNWQRRGEERKRRFLQLGPPLGEEPAGCKEKKSRGQEKKVKKKGSEGGRVGGGGGIISCYI